MTWACRCSILVLDDEPTVCQALQRAFGREGCKVQSFTDPSAALADLEKRSYDLMLCDVRLPGADGLQLLPRLRGAYPEMWIIMITAYGTFEAAVEAIRQGAYDYIVKPFTPEVIRHAVQRALEHRELQVRAGRKQGSGRRGREEYEGESDAIRRALSQADQVAGSNASILITGESGTGKEVLARRIHAASPRRDGPFVPVNCAAIPETVLEGELFGHVKGAFTGAIADHQGLIEAVHGGTLFLDEIGQMRPDLQTKLLRAAEDRHVRRLGSDRQREVDVRIVAAAQQPPDVLLATGALREDLYYRLAVVHIRVPPLRDRAEDIPGLAAFFLRRLTEDMKKPEAGLTPGALEVLCAHGWPGNVRELRNAIEHAVLFAPAGQPIGAAYLPARVHGPALTSPFSVPMDRVRTLEEIEEGYIRHVIEACKGNRAEAARLLGISPTTIWRRLKEEPEGPAPR